MNHEEMIVLLHDFACGRLNDDDRLIVQRALENDPALAGELDRVRAYYNDLKSLPGIKAPDGFLLKVRERIERKGFFVKLRDLVFFPLSNKLPVEIAGALGVSLLVIIIFNPFAPKVRVVLQEESAITLPEAIHEDNLRKDNENKELSRYETKNFEKKQEEPLLSGKASQPLAAFPKSGGRRRSIQRSGSFAEPMPSARELDARKAEAGMTVSDALAKKADEGAAKVMEEVRTAGLSKAKTSVTEPPAFAAAPSSAPAVASTMMDQQPSPAGATILAEAPPEQFAYIWTPEEPAEYAPSAEYETVSRLRAEKKVMRPVGKDKSAASMSINEPQVSDQSVADNKLKSDNLALLKAIVKHAGGSLKVVNQKALHYRIKIPGKNFKQFENELKKRGVFSSDRAIDGSRVSSKEMIEIIVTVKE